MAKPTLFDFQKSASKRYKSFAKRKRSKRFRALNRFVLLLLILAVGFGSYKACQQTALEQSNVQAEDLQNDNENQTDGEEDIDTNEVIAEPTSEVDTTDTQDNTGLQINYQKDLPIAKKMYQLLREQRPGAAVYLVVDLESNEILAWAGRSDSMNHTEPAWLSKSTFPAASLIKILTSAAAFESNRFSTNSDIPIIGRSTTLYYRQLRVPNNYKGPYITVEDAFAKSCNPSMAIIGQTLGGKKLRNTALRLGFNRPFPGNTPNISRFMPPDSGYALAEAASGFTRANTISPLHSAAIIRGIIKRKKIEIPWSKTLPEYAAPKQATPLEKTEFRPETYGALRQLMLRTVTHGTARKHLLRQIPQKTRDRLWIGGKTGSLDGTDPKGRYDWFAGFVQSKENPKKGAVVIVMQVHQKYRSQYSTAVAGIIINSWAKNHLN